METKPSINERQKNVIAARMSFARGQENKVSKEEVIDYARQFGINLTVRTFRAIIHELRREGLLICSSSGVSGYWLASSFEDVQSFLTREMRSKVADMRKTISAMENAARSEFGSQLGMF